MKRFLVISNHKAEDCNLALKETLAIGYLSHFDWGCKDGEHTGWAVLEAEDKEQAMLVFVAKALSPAQVDGVVIDEENRVANVTVPERMLSLAIGRGGQNASLAAKLTGWRINIRSDTQALEPAPAPAAAPVAAASPAGEAGGTGEVAS